MTLRQRLLAGLALPLLLTAGAARSQTPKPTAEKSAPPAAARASSLSADRAAARAKAGLARAWWNQPKAIETLALTDAQRRKMDQVLLAHLATRREAALAYVENRRHLGDLLVAGDWKGAERSAAEAGELAAKMARSEGELAVAVARALEPEQREKLDAEFPQLLRRPLVQSGTGGRGGPRGARPGRTQS